MENFNSPVKPRIPIREPSSIWTHGHLTRSVVIYSDGTFDQTFYNSKGEVTKKMINCKTEFKDNNIRTKIQRKKSCRNLNIKLKSFCKKITCTTEIPPY